MTPLSRPRRALLLTTALTVLSTAALTGCAAGAAPAGTAPTRSDPASDVDVEGASELREPARALVAADEKGALTLIALETERREVLAKAAGPIAQLDSDGRFLFVAREGEREGDTAVELLDSGRWTMPHGDHSHYFRAEPRALGAIEGAGPAMLGIGAEGTAIAFADDDEVVILDHEALAEEGADAATRTTAAGPALPFAGELLVATASGIEVPGAPVAPCASPSDAEVTRVGAVFACAEGAVLVTREVGGALAVESVPLPAGADAAASDLSGRADRPDLAGVSGDGDAWLLDVRARAWTLLPSDAPLVRAAAIGDDDSRTVAVAADGSVRVLGADGAVLGRTEPLVAASLADPALRDSVQLLIDADRAYVSDPAAGVVHEITIDEPSSTRAIELPQVRAIALVG